MLRKSLLLLLPCAFSFLINPSLHTVSKKSQLMYASKNTNTSSEFDIDIFQQNMYLGLLENKTMSQFNSTVEKRHKKNETETLLRRKKYPQKKKKNTYIESLIIPIFQFEEEADDNNNDEDDPDDYLTKRKKLYRIGKSSSSEGTFKLEELDKNFNFSKIGGYSQVKKELAQVIDFLKNPQNYTKYGVRIPRGLLLEGPPGNGKTILAKGLAGEAKTSFITTAGSGFNELYIGVGAKRVRELFDLANDNLPCIIFIDELDAAAKKRTGSSEGADSERDQTLNQLLVSMDGFNNKGGLLVVGATNRADILDKAILRPGRFDKIITVPNPDAATREEIIKIHSKKKPLNVNITDLVKLTAGFSGAQIENIINEAVLYGIRNDSLPVKINTFDMIRDRILLGQTTKKKELSESAIRRISFHEVGHLLMGLKSKYVEKVDKVTIDSQSGASLGYTMFETSDLDEGLYMREYFEDKLKVLLGGRVAEEIIYGLSVSSGAVSDLEQAFSMAKSMIMNFGMGDKIIYPYFSEQYKKEIDDEIHRVINRAYKDTKQVLESNKVLLIKLSNQLYNRKTLTYPEICNIILEANAEAHKQKTQIKNEDESTTCVSEAK